MGSILKCIYLKCIFKIHFCILSFVFGWTEKNMEFVSKYLCFKYIKTFFFREIQQRQLTAELKESAEKLKWRNCRYTKKNMAYCHRGDTIFTKPENSTFEKLESDHFDSFFLKYMYIYIYIYIYIG